MMNWSVVLNDEVVRHYPFDQTGHDTAYNHARKFNYELWQSFNGEPRYLMRSRRTNGETE
jgi:hypothetical protein